MQGLKKKVESLSLISSNEEIDDIATTDLKFILVDYYLADLLQKGANRLPTAHKMLLFCRHHDRG